MTGGWLGGALVLGLSAGLSPGPMLALVLSESVRSGFGAGARIALAPLLTDGPIVLLVAIPFLLLTDPAPVLALLGLLGAAYLVWLAVGSLRVSVSALQAAEQSRGALRRGVIANFLNPNPYLFWLTLGLPGVLQLAEQSGAAAAGFVLVFYAGLVGSKLLLARLAASGGQRMDPRLHLWVLRGLGLALLVYALLLLRSSLLALSA